MTKLTITRGLPASLKTTWARELCKSTDTVRVNRDDTRMMLFGRKSGLTFAQENLVTSAVQNLVTTFLKAGQDVVADDMNLRPVYVRQWRKLAYSLGAEFRVVEFSISVEESISRQYLRPIEDRVPAEAIKEMKKFLGKGDSLLPVPDEDAPLTPVTYVAREGAEPVVLCDLDGTAALMNGRGPHDYHRVSEDLVNVPVLATLKALSNDGLGVVFMSGRHDGCRAETEEWLRKNVMPHLRENNLELHMRKEGDMRRDAIVKRELFDAHIRPHYDVRLVLDDRTQVVEMFRDLGLTVLQVAEGNF